MDADARTVKGRMMKKILYYKCEFCNEEYETEEEAIKCESMHPKVKRIVAVEYNDHMSKYIPDGIIVELDDGRVACYTDPYVTEEYDVPQE